MIYKKAKGCCRFDCDDYPRVFMNRSLKEENLTIIVTNGCRNCKHFMPFDMYINGKKEFQRLHKEIEEKVLKEKDE